MDCSLNKDVDDSVKWHVAVTSKVPVDDPRKFSRATKNEQDRAYLRVWDPVIGVSPTKKRIVQDCERFFVHLKAISENKGCVIQGLGSRSVYSVGFVARNGHRKVEGGPDHRGGLREKKAYSNCRRALCSDAEEVFAGGVPLEPGDYEDEEVQFEMVAVAGTARTGDLVNDDDGDDGEELDVSDVPQSDADARDEGEEFAKGQSMHDMDTDGDARHRYRVDNGDANGDDPDYEDD